MSNSITVSEIQTTAQNNITSVIQGANVFLQDVANYAGSALDIPAFTIDVPTVDPYLGQNVILDAQASAFPALDFTRGRPVIATSDKPSAPTISGIDIPTFGSVPQLLYSPPPVSFPVTPDSTLPAAPGAAPTPGTVVLPDPLSVTVPAVPVFSNIAIPPPPAVTIPQFTTTLPSESLLAPTNSFSFTEQPYQDPLLDDLKLKLMADLVNGGYGIEPLDEQSLWERAREREMLAADSAIDQATTLAAARGFILPPGALLAQIEGAQQAALEKISSVSREIALKRADLYVQNRQFTIQQTQQCEQMLITYFGYMMERALNYARYQAEFGIQYFNSQVALYNMRLEATRVASQVYETQLRAALANLEAWKTTIEGSRLDAEIQKLQVDVYNTQLEGVRIYVDIYRTEMEAARVQADVERLKMELFKTQVEAYVAQVGAKVSAYELFKAQIGGEEAKIGLYRTEVESYSTQVNAFATEVNAKKAIVEAEAISKNLQVDVYKAQLQGYIADIQKGQAELSAQVQKYDGDIRRFGTFMQAIESGVQAIIDAQKSNALIAAEKAKIASSHMTNVAQAMTTHDSLAAQVASHMFNTIAQEAIAYAEQAAGIAIEPGS